MVTLVGATDWALPGAQVQSVPGAWGDTVVAVQVAAYALFSSADAAAAGNPSRLRPGLPVPEGFTHVERLYDHNRWEVRIYTAVVPESGVVFTTVPATPDYGYGLHRMMLITVGDTNGIHEVSSTAGKVRVWPGAGALHVQARYGDRAEDVFTGLDTVGTLPLPDAGLASGEGATVQVYWGAEAGGYSGSQVTAFPGSASALKFSTVGPPEQATPVWPTEAAVVPDDRPVRFQWRLPERDFGRPVVQAEFELRARVPRGLTGYDYFSWDPVAGVFVTDRPRVAGSDPHVEVPAEAVAALPAGEREWAVLWRDAVSGRWNRDLANPQWTSFALGTPPSVEVTGPLLVEGDLSPLVTWNAEPASGAIDAYRVLVRDGNGSTVWDSGQQAGGSGAVRVPPVEWVNGASYVPVVEVRQSNGLWSLPVEGAPFPISWTPPAAPEVRADAWKPGVVVTVTHPTAAAAVVEKATSDGWVLLARAAFVDGVASVRDVLAAYGEPTSYRVRVEADLTGGTVRSVWVEADPVVSKDGFSYLVRDSDRQQFVRVYITQDRRGVSGAEATVTAPFGAPHKVRYGTDRGRTGTLTLITYDDADRATLAEWLGRNETMLLRFPPEGHDKSIQGEVIRLARSSQWTPERRAQTTTIGWREFTFDWVEVP